MSETEIVDAFFLTKIDETKLCILKQMREAGLAQVGLQISPKWAIFSRMD